MKRPTPTLSVVDHVYPNGYACKWLMFGDDCLGSYTVEAGSYLPSGKRKPSPSEWDAILRIIKDNIKATERELVWLDSAWKAAFSQQHEFRADSAPTAVQ